VAEVALEALEKVYPDGTRAVEQLDLEIADGEFMVFVGPSGCGKTSVLRMVAGLEEITGGVVRIGGRVVNDLLPKQRDIAMVFQNYALYPHMDGYDNMAFGLRRRHMPKPEIDQRVRGAATTLGLGEVLRKKPRTLSGGQRQRVAMGRAVVREPQVFLMDEPLSNLDAKLRVEMRAEILRIQRDLGVTTIYVTHDQTEAMTMGDRVAVMRRGVLQQVDRPQRIYDRPANLFVAEFIGSPAMNLIEAELARSDDGLVASFGEHRLLLGPRVAAEPGRAIIGIRPEDFQDAALAPPRRPGSTLSVVSEIREDMGPEVYVHFALGVPPSQRIEIAEAQTDGDETAQHVGARARSPFVARLGRHTRAAEGRPLTLAVDVDSVYVFDAETGEGRYAR
jgi:multiple sugar transport system ATP-binding protein